MAGAVFAGPLLGGAAYADEPEAKPAENPAAAAEPAPERRVGRMVRIPMPITDKVDNQIRRIVESVITETKRAGQWPVFIFEIEPGRANFGQAYDLANFLSGPALNGATTVAWIPKTITGHAVLIAMACDEIVMSPDAEIGKAGEYEKVIEPSVRNAYVGIANRRMNIPSDVALALLDPEVELVMVETDVSREYALASRLDELRKQKSFEKPKVIKPAGQPGIFTGSRAWELGFVKSLASDRAEVAKALGLPRDAVEADPSLDGAWRPVAHRHQGTHHVEAHGASPGAGPKRDQGSRHEFLLPVDRFRRRVGDRQYQPGQLSRQPQPSREAHRGLHPARGAGRRGVRGAGG